MEKELLRFEVLREGDGVERCDHAIIFLLCLNGSLTVEADGERSVLNMDDVCVINAKTAYTLNGDDCLYVRYAVDMGKFRQTFPLRYCFRCDSTKEQNDNYIILRRYLTDLLRLRYEGGEYERAEIQKTVYEMLIFLVSNFTLVGVVPETPDKIDMITDYIDSNFQDELPLEKISRQFHMAAPSFSRFFKQKMGVTFYQYLSKVRLEHAVDNLLHTDKNLLHIAMDSGFPNTASLNRYFTEEFGILPQKYRACYRAERMDRKEQQQAALSQALTQLGLVRLRPDSSRRLALTVDVARHKPYTPFWNRIVNIGNADLMTDYDGQRQMRHLQEVLEFGCARLSLDCKGFLDEKSYSFFDEERRLDYLVRQKLNLWLVTDFRTVGDRRQFLRYLKSFLSHFSNRYSLHTVRQWQFELVYNTLPDEKKFAAYWAFYQQITELLKSFEVGGTLLGPGMALGNWQGIRAFYAYMEQNGLSLPVQTLMAEPYTCVMTEDGISVNRATDSSYLKNALSMLQQQSRFFRQEVRQIYITSWSESLLRTNMLNDSCYRGATIIKNIIDCFGTVETLICGVPFDAAYTENLQGPPLFGGDGLLSKHGLHKPGFYAYQFMQRVGRHYLTRDAHAIVFSDGEANYQIICHNRKRLSYRYYLEEEHLTWEHLPEYFDDLETLELSYRLINLKNGTYLVKSRSVSQDYGSVQDELHRMAEDENTYIHSNDLEYLRQVAVPQVRLRTYSVTDGTLTLSVTLTANEFSYLHIIYQY